MNYIELVGDGIDESTVLINLDNVSTIVKCNNHKGEPIVKFYTGHLTYDKYSDEVVYDHVTKTFPFPHSPTESAKRSVVNVRDSFFDSLSKKLRGEE